MRYLVEKSLEIRYNKSMCDIVDGDSLISLAELIGHRRKLHQIAELSGRELQTQQYVADCLTSYGIKYSKIGTGIVADVKGKTKQFIAFRADMDALPITESPKPYQSQTPGVSHLCGHDAHMSMLLGFARYLSVKQPPVSVRLIFQPSEECGGGAETMIDRGCLDRVRLIFGTHITAERPTGEISTIDGGLFAGTVDYKIEFTGKSAHITTPDRACDALQAANAYLQETQKIFQDRYASTCLHGIGALHAGTAHNVIADRAEISGSFRFYDDAKKEAFFMDAERALCLIDQRFGTQHRLTVFGAYPPLINTPDLTRTVIKELHLSLAQPRYTAEDFSYYLNYADGMFVWLGAGDTTQHESLHSKTFDIDERAMISGVQHNINILGLVASGKI